MARKPKNKDIENASETQVETTYPIPTTKQEWDNFYYDFASGIRNSLLSVSESASNGMYNPMTAQAYLQSVNINPRVPTQTELTTWVSNPSVYATQLRETQQYLENAIMQHKRATDHFAKILTFKNDLRAIDTPKSSEEIKQWKNGYSLCLEYLKKFNIPYHTNNIMKKVVSEGVFFGYIQENQHFVSIVEMPSDWCYITGRFDWGFTYAVDLSFFDRMINIENMIPELYEYYKRFVELRKAGLRGEKLAPYQYYPIPVEKSVCITFDPLRPEKIPPLTPVFADASYISEYKRLLKTRTALDTYKVIAQIIPLDKDNKPSVDAITAGKIVQAVQQILPPGIKTFSSPFSVQDVSFANASNPNNIVGIGEAGYFRSAGINGSLMDITEKTGVAQKYSIINDYNFIRHLYSQFENLINIQLWLKSRTWRFRSCFYGNAYTDDDDAAAYSNLVKTCNLPVGKLFGYAGFQPYEVDSVLIQEDILGWKDKLKPIISGFQQSGADEDGGRPTKGTSNLSEGGEKSRDYDSNNDG